MSAPVSTFAALTTPLLDGDNRIACWTWQQKFIEWETRINQIATTTTLGIVKVDGVTIAAAPDGTISAVGLAFDFSRAFMLMGA